MPPYKHNEENGVYKVSLIWKRLLNFILDCIGLSIFIFILVSILDFGHLSLINDNYQAFLIIILIIYYLFFEFVLQRTPGKFITKTKVVKKDGTKPSFLSIIYRTFSRFIPFDAFSFLFRNNPIGWHDNISDTIVVASSYSDKDVKRINFNKNNKQELLNDAEHIIYNNLITKIKEDIELKSDLDVLIIDEIKKSNYFNEEWQMHYAKERIENAIKNYFEKEK